ncbi:MAG: (2Fe-2S)-binding protein [Zhaonellaceae bacterium]|nr:(2Fe-2S)-binding protein [Clostridia bacterium]
MQLIKLLINGKEYEVAVKKNWTLLYVLREVLDFTGTKCGCNTNDCGACKVLIDGEAVNSCVVLAHKAEGKNIITIEGIAEGSKLHPIQEAFIETGAVQCGFCTPGMIITTKALLDQNPSPSRDEIVQALDNNLCRCTGYVKIVEAIELAAKRLRGEA